MPLEALPDTAWRLIAKYLADSPPDLLTIAQLSPALKHICRPLLSSHYEMVHQGSVLLSHDYPWHDMLILVLNEYIDPLFIYDLHCPAREERQSNFVPDGTTRPALRSCNTSGVAQYDRLFRRAANQFMPKDIVEEAVDQFNSGSVDAALAVLLPLCKRIKHIWFCPGNMPLLGALFQDITDRYASLGISDIQARQYARKAVEIDIKHIDSAIERRYARQHDSKTLPFAELLFIDSRESQCDRNVALDCFLPFLGIPSLHRIVLGEIRRASRTRPLDWPPDIRCQCPEIYFARSDLDQETLMAFIEGLSSDCDIKQWYGNDPHDGYFADEPDWDHALVAFDETGQKVVAIRFDFDGGIYGYEHAWVCHILYGKMCSWRHWDEEMKTVAIEEGHMEVDGPL